MHYIEFRCRRADKKGRLRTTTFNQKNQPVQSTVGTLLLPRGSKPDGPVVIKRSGAGVSLLFRTHICTT
jgi:hypothetical protein